MGGLECAKGWGWRNGPVGKALASRCEDAGWAQTGGSLVFARQARQIVNSRFSETIPQIIR